MYDSSSDDDCVSVVTAEDRDDDSVQMDFEDEDDDDDYDYDYSLFDEEDYEPLYTLPEGYKLRSTSWPQSDYYRTLQEVQKDVSDTVKLENMTQTTGYVLLRDALFYGDADVAKRLLNAGVDVNDSKQLGDTPLHYASSQGLIDIVKLLLSKGAIVDAKNNTGETPLHKAVAANETEVAELLVSNNADVNATLENGLTALHCAVEHGNETTVRLLLKEKANASACARVTHVNRSGLGFAPVRISTPLLVAAKYGHETIAKILLENGANVNEHDNFGDTVLGRVVETGSTSFVDLVLSFSPDLSVEKNRSLSKVIACVKSDQFNNIMDSLVRYGFTITFEEAEDSDLLCNAIENGRLNLVAGILKQCRDAGSFINRPCGHDGNMALHVACKHGQEDIVKMLISFGADVNAEDGLGETALHCTVPPLRTDKKDENVGIVKLLLSSGANVNGKDSRGIPTLERAIVEDCDKIVEELLEHNANVHDYFLLPTTSRCNRLNPLILSVFQRNPVVVSMLLNKGAQVNSRSVGKANATALHIACGLEYEDIVEVLLKHPDVDVNSVDSVGHTPLHIAASSLAINLSAALLDHGAEINVKDNTGATPLHIAAKESPEALETLLARGADCNSTNMNGETPLHIAATSIFDRNIKLLLKHGADIDAIDVSGKTPLYLASVNKCSLIVKMLLEFGADTNVSANSLPRYTPLKCAQEEYATTPEAKIWVGGGSMFGRMVDLKYYLVENINFLRRNIIMKMTLMPSSVNKTNLEAIDFNDPKVDTFQSECERELVVLQQTKIGETQISFYVFLTTRKNKVAQISKIKEIADILKSRKLYKKKFPIYFKMIKLRFKMGNERAILLEDARSKVSFLPHVCVDVLTEYLNNLSLKNLIKAFN